MTSSLRLYAITSLILAIFCASCSLSKKDSKISDEQIQKAFNAAMAHAASGSILVASNEFTKMDQDFPFSEYSGKIQIMLVYTKIAYGAFNEVTPIVETFEKLYPLDDALEYMTFMKVMASYKRITDARKDKDVMIETLAGVAQMNTRYPKSKYSGYLAKIKSLTDDMLLSGKIDVTNHYYASASCLASVNRGIELLNELSASHPKRASVLKEVEGCLKTLSLGGAMAQVQELEGSQGKKGDVKL